MSVQKSLAKRKIGLIAIVLIVLMAITPAFIQIGAEVHALSVINQMFIVGLVMTLAYSDWRSASKAQSASFVNIMAQSKVLVFGLMYGLLVIVVNAFVGMGGNLLLGDLSGGGFYLTILAGVSEELFFRGFIQNFFRSWMRSWYCVFPAAAIFAGFHYFRYGLTEPVGLIVMFAIGIGFGLVYEVTGDIGAPMLAHIINNAAASMSLVIMWVQGSMMVIGVLIAVLVVSIILGRSKRRR